MFPAKTLRLVLRPFRRSDAPTLVPLIGDYDVARNTARIPHPYTMADAETFFRILEEHPERPIAAVTLEDSVIGGIGFDLEPAHDRGELGYWIGQPFRGQGYATEAARAMIELGFTKLCLNRITAHHYTRNPASGCVLEKAGMLREGLLKQHMKRWGTYEDCVAYGLTREDWERQCANL